MAGRIDWGAVATAASTANQARAQQVSRVINPGTIRDVPTLNHALKTGAINKTQWMQRFQQIQPKVNGVNTPAPYSLRNTTSSLGAAVNKVLVQPIKSLPQSEKTVATGVARILPGGTADIEAQRKASDQAAKNAQIIIQMHKAGKISKSAATRLLANNAAGASANSAEMNKTIKAMPTKGQLAAGFAGTAADILTAGTLKAAEGAGVAARTARVVAAPAAFGADAALGTGAAGGTKKQIAEAGLVGAAIPLAGKGVSHLKQTFIDGPKALRAAEAAKPKNIPVRDIGGPQSVDVRTPIHATVKGGNDVAGIPVRTPLRAGVKEVSQTDKINVRTPQPMTEPEFDKQFNQIHAAYDRESNQLHTAAKSMPGKQIMAAQNKLEQKYQGQLNKLQDDFHNPQLSAPVAPKKLASSTTKAGPTRGGVIQTKTPRIPKEPRVTAPKPAIQSKVTTQAKEPMSAPKPPAKEANARTAPNVPGSTKVAGSSLKIEEDAVKRGISARMSDLPEFETVNKADQAKKVTKLINEDRQRALDIAEGRVNPPNGVHPQAVHNGMVQLARKTADGDLIERLARSPLNRELSEGAQKLSLAAERDPHDPVEAVRQITAEKVKTAERQGLTKKVPEEIKAIRAAKSTVKTTKQDWNSFIDDLRCS